MMPAADPEILVDAASCCLSYWPCSPEAYRVFKPRKHETRNCEHSNDDDLNSETPMETLQRRIELLRSAHEKEDNWRNVIQGRDSDNRVYYQG